MIESGDPYFFVRLIYELKQLCMSDEWSRFYYEVSILISLVVFYVVEVSRVLPQWWRLAKDLFSPLSAQRLPLRMYSRDGILEISPSIDGINLIRGILYSSPAWVIFLLFFLWVEVSLTLTFSSSWSEATLSTPMCFRLCSRTSGTLSILPHRRTSKILFWASISTRLPLELYCRRFFWPPWFIC